MTVVQLVNLALLKLGISQTIGAIDEASREAATANLVYDTTLRQCLRRFPWPFATKYAPLYLTAGPFWNTDPTELTYVQAWDSTFNYEVGDVVRRSNINYYCILAHTSQQPPNATYWSTSEANAPDEANGDWKYSYRYPSDCLYARRIVPPGGNARQFSDTPIQFREHRDDNGLLISTNQQDAALEYTMLDCTNLWTDDLFLYYFTWSLAAAMCPSLERAQKTVIACLRLAEAAYEVARVAAMNEGQQHPDGDASWIRGR